MRWVAIIGVAAVTCGLAACSSQSPATSETPVATTVAHTATTVAPAHTATTVTPARPDPPEVRPRPGSPPEPAPEPEPFVPETLPAGYLHFDGACLPGTAITIAAVGDLLMHHELQRQAMDAEEGFIDIWAGVLDLLGKADLTYANLEGPMAPGLDFRAREVPDPGKAFDDRVYSGYPRFNYHPSLATDLVASGVDIVSMVNNHVQDRGPVGLDRSLDALDAAGLTHYGARRQGTDEALYKIVRVKGITLAWVGCTLYTNQPDPHDQVIWCYKKPDRITPLVRKLAADPAIDAVIATPHMGMEYVPAPGKKETELVGKLLDAGALAVIGAHAHVLQPWQRQVTADGRETFAISSLGNFCSHQKQLPRRSSMILYLGLTKAADGRTRINGARYVPIHVREQTADPHARFYVEAIDRVLGRGGRKSRRQSRPKTGGASASRKLTAAMFGELNVLGPDEPLVTNPHCDPAWPHHVR